MTVSEKQDYFLPISVEGLAAGFVICLGVVLIAVIRGEGAAIQTEVLIGFIAVFILFFGVWSLIRLRAIRHSNQRCLQ